MNMRRDEAYEAVMGMVFPESGEEPLVCGESGHGAGHVCIPLAADVAPDEDWFDLGGASAGVRGLPEALGGETVEWVVAWPWSARWVGVGRTGGVRPVLAVLERTTPDLAALPSDATWLDALVAVTGWEATGVRAPEVEWGLLERGLGMRLPQEYKALVETFGPGRFDSFLDLTPPQDLHPSTWPGDGHDRLVWASNEHRDTFYWLMDGPDPERWPVCGEADTGRAVRFDCGPAEVIFRYLVDPDFPFRIPTGFRAQWFDAWGCEE
ncbi:hypothetical protein GCM10010329_07680 [Streptomyces spiroverticillatus]|uniref:SMI1/KNR4 family protein n=1 Tax=Streptomyces finlayi TaxID=67296 RepID=A0A918WTU0_9ACTN|nr:SMI1/KNR4 family protein [Streptomyces finlayi]GGZ89713.1 hypothetical protein GCM10010329_07680 [Streptomyces spiroverticillatus]GHC80549.1 hypothetical protein GCM10010334_07670 [Streptomyces finlayi]